MTAEQRQVLAMLAEHRITREEAFRLLLALHEGPRPAEGSAAWVDFERMLDQVNPDPTVREAELPPAAGPPRHVRVRVQSATGDRVNLRMPITLATQIARWVPAGRFTVNGGQMSVGAVLDLIQRSERGTILEVDTDDGDRVLVTLE